MTTSPQSSIPAVAGAVTGGTSVARSTEVRIAAAHAQGRFTLDELPGVKTRLAVLDRTARLRAAALRTHPGEVKTNLTPVQGCTDSCPTGGGGQQSPVPPPGYTLVDGTTKRAANAFYSAGYLSGESDGSAPSVASTDDSSYDVQVNYSDGTAILVVATEQAGRYAVLRPDGSATIADVATTTTGSAGETVSYVRSATSWQSAYNTRFTWSPGMCKAAQYTGTGIFGALGSEFGPIGTIAFGAFGAYMTGQILARHTNC